MPLSVACTACQRTLQVKEDLAGKRVKCPGCGTIVSVPSVDAPAGPARSHVESRRSEESERPVRKNRRKLRHSRDVDHNEPKELFSLLGIAFTKTKLFIAVGIVVVFVPVLFFFFRASPFSNRPDVKAVDVYCAINGMRGTDVGERVLQSKTVAWTVPGHRSIMVTRPNPNGDFILAKVRVPHKITDACLPRNSNVGTVFLGPGHIQLQGGGETVDAIFVTDKNDEPGIGYHLGYSPPKQEGRVSKLTDYIGPGDRFKNHTHEGELKQKAGDFVFKGKNGMEVTVATGDERLDGREGGSVLGNLGIKNTKGIEDANLVAGPDAFVRVTWDVESSGWIFYMETERPNDISLSWEIICLFPRPKKAGKELTLMVFGTPHPIKLP